MISHYKSIRAVFPRYMWFTFLKIYYTVTLNFILELLNVYYKIIHSNFIFLMSYLVNKVKKRHVHN